MATRPAVAGVVSQVRTHLLEVMADLTADTPLTELPRKEQVDAAVSNRIGQARDVYNTTIHEAGGPVAIVPGAKASTEGLTVEGVVRLLDKVCEVARDVETRQRDELMDAVTDRRSDVAKESPDTREVIKPLVTLPSGLPRSEPLRRITPRDLTMITPWG